MYTKRQSLYKYDVAPLDFDEACCAMNDVLEEATDARLRKALSLGFMHVIDYY